MIGDAYQYEGSLYAFFDTLQHFGLFDRAELYRRTGALTVPTMLMWGTEDRVTPIDGLDQVRALLKPRQCYVVDDCGHMVPFERPALVADKLAAFAAPSTDR
jgi:pimeloyl-ACP methyl ester carboxylesterase